MKLTLKRYGYTKEGIFGFLLDDQNNILFYTLEHAYLQSDGTYAPKIPVGNYTCKRGTYPKNGETFEVMDVPGHSAILFHTGNYNKDSDGCILVGLDQGDEMITQSRKAFAQFLQLMDGVNSFELEVV